MSSGPIFIQIHRAGITPWVLSADLFGQPAGEYLARTLETRIGARFRLLATGSRRELPGPGTNQMVIIADADLWLSTRLIDVLAETVSGASRAVALVAKHGKRDDVLAVVCPTRSKSWTDVRKSVDLRGGLSRFNRASARVSKVDADAADPGGGWARLTDLVALAAAEQRVLRERALHVVLAGVRLRDIDHTYIRGELRCGSGVEIDVGVIIQGRVTLGDNVIVGPYAILSDAAVGDGTRIGPFTLIDGAEIGSGGRVGPYARLRPGTSIGAQAQIGNFVEIKNSLIGPGARINHHAFVGDATLGSNVTLGAGTITCNHDGTGTARTEIGDGAYIGSGTELVAPIIIGAGATIGAGSTITDDAPPRQLTVARARQVSIVGWKPRGPGAT